MNVQSTSSQSGSVYFKGLNGIRAIAAFGVVVAHIQLLQPLAGLPPTTTTNLAGFGVTIFFSLSGFLITYLLLLEKERQGRINISHFYIRRILRIWPLYYFYLTIPVLTVAFMRPDAFPGSIIYYILLAANIPFVLGRELPLLGHFWSLGVEEQFYVFWPWVVNYSRRLLRTLSVFTIVFLLAKLLARLIDIYCDVKLPYLLLHVTRFECMAIGAIGAMLLHRKNQSFLRAVMSLPLQLVAWAVVILIAVNRFHIISTFDHDIVAMITIVLIINVSQNDRSIVKLSFWPMDLCGRISYGIYVYHVIILFFMASLLSNYGGPQGMKYFLLYAVTIGLTVLVAHASYELFEKRFLRWKGSYSVVSSSASPLSNSETVSALSSCSPLESAAERPAEGR
jgi:peptidoglycan/LPS O-acetylase OafA/YrhL